MRLLLGFFPALALLAQSQAAPDAGGLLMRSGGSVLTADTVRLEGTESRILVLPASRRTSNDSFSFRRSRDRLRFETKSDDSTTLRISDGARVWRYTSGSNSYTYQEKPTPDRLANDPFGRIKFSRDPADFRDARVDREESLEFGGRQVPCYVVRAAYDFIPGSPQAWDVVRTVWIAKDTGWVLRDVWAYSTNAAASLAMGKSSITTDYTAIETGVPLADNLFVFHPPEGSYATSGDAPSSPAAFIRGGYLQSTGAILVRKTQPAYTPESRAAGLQGIVSLYVEIDRDGKPSTVEVMQGLGMGLDEMAVDAVKRWTYQPGPAAADGLQDAFEVEVPFHLDPPAPWHVTSEYYGFLVSNRERFEKLERPVLVRYTAPDAAACREAGTAAVRFKIAKDGAPQAVRSQGGDGGALADAAVKAIATWQFKPAAGDKKKIEAQAEVEFTCAPGGDQPKTADLPSVYRVGGHVSAPVLLSKLEPGYSEAARRDKVQGTSMLYAQISPRGRATNIRVVARLGHGLDRKAIEAVKRWHFQPGSRDGEPVTVEATIEVNFRLK